MFNRSLKIFLILCLSVGVLLALGIGVISQENKCEDPDTLVYAAMSQERAPVVAERMEGLLNYIAEKTGKEVNIYLTTSYAAQAEAMIGGYADIANFGPFGYVLATEKDPTMEVFATYAVKPMPEHWVPGGPAYVGILVTKKGSEFDSIEALKGATVGFPDPGSTSGWLVPNVLFTKEELGGKALDEYFGKLIFTGSHDANILAVIEGRIDAGFTWDSAPYRLWKRGEMGKPADELNLLWSSPEIPLDPYTYQTELCPALKEKIKTAFLTAHNPEKCPECQVWFEAVGGTKFVEMKDQDYDVIRELHEAKKKME